MFANKNFKNWSIWKRSSPLEDNFSAVVEEITGRAFWLNEEIHFFLLIYGLTAIPFSIANAINNHWSFNSVVLIIIITFTFWFCFKLRREIQAIYLTGGPRISNE